jgi:hypothetical protein
VSSLDLCVHYIIGGFLFHVVRVELYGCQFFDDLKGFQEWWKICLKEVHIEYWMHTKEGWSVEIKRIATHILSDSLRPITKWVKISMGPDEFLLMQM